MDDRRQKRRGRGRETEKNVYFNCLEVGLGDLLLAIEFTFFFSFSSFKLLLSFRRVAY
jgi:hypothetical protein